MFVIVESENCFKYVNRKYGKRVTYLTTSPYLLNFFEENKITKYFFIFMSYYM